MVGGLLFCAGCERTAPEFRREIALVSKGPESWIGDVTPTAIRLSTPMERIEGQSVRLRAQSNSASWTAIDQSGDVLVVALHRQRCQVSPGVSAFPFTVTIITSRKVITACGIDAERLAAMPLP